MKCMICEREISWNESVGKPEFLVCNDCFEDLCCDADTDKVNVSCMNSIMNVLYKIGERIKEKRK